MRPTALTWATAGGGGTGARAGDDRGGRQPADGRPARTVGRGADAGTAIPLIMVSFLLAGTFVCGSIAASAAFLAQRDLAGICDGAAIAAANAFSRAGAAGDPAGRSGGDLTTGLSGPDGRESLPLDAEAVQRAVVAYRTRQLPDTGDSLSMTATTDGRVATVTCRRRVRIPFGGLLGYRDGLDRTVVARARSPLD
jgi:hypothetical protein